MAIGWRRPSLPVGLLLGMIGVAMLWPASARTAAASTGRAADVAWPPVVCAVVRTSPVLDLQRTRDLPLHRASMVAALAVLGLLLVTLFAFSRRLFPHSEASGETAGAVAMESEPARSGDQSTVFTGSSQVSSARSEAEAAIALANERTALALQAGRMGTFDIDVETGIVHNSPQRLEIFGVDAASFDGRLATLDALIHPDDVERVRANRRLGQQRMEPFETEFRIIRPDGMTRWVLSRARAYRGPDGKPRFEFGVTMDITERKLVERQLAEAAQQAARQLKELQALYASAPIGLALFDRNLTAVRINTAMADIYGIPPTEQSGSSVREALGAIASTVEPRLKHVLETGEAMLNVEIEQVSADDPSERRFFRSHYYPLLDEGSLIAGVGLIIEEITEDKRVAERQKLLTRELRHRANNMLAVIQSVARRSLSGDRSLADARVDLLERLQALARAHNMLTESDWQGVELASLVRLELEGLDERATISGPHVVLGSGPAQTFALVLHELTINALKHGALSVPQGRVEVTWRVSGSGASARFHFRWQETGGPIVHAPVRRGFGTELLERAIVEDFDKPARVQFLPAGVLFEIDVPYAIVRS